MPMMPGDEPASNAPAQKQAVPDFVEKNLDDGIVEKIPAPKKEDAKKIAPQPAPQTAPQQPAPQAISQKVIQSKSVAQTPAPAATQPAPAATQPAASATQPVPRENFPRRPWYRSPKMCLGILLLLFLLGGATLVPVSKIPFLRNLVYAMGFSPDDAKKLSFLKALLSWTDHQKRMNGELPSGDELSAFGARGGFNSANEQAKNKLINYRAVNASLAKRGKKGDYLSGTYDDTLDQATGRYQSNISVDNPEAAANTQANKTDVSQVFFGEDASNQYRDKNDGFNSVNTLKKVANKPVAGTSGEDWLGRLIDKARSTDSGLEEITKKFDRDATNIAKLGSSTKVGDTRARRDLYWAWFMGRAGRRTPQMALKKTLAAASFDGADMPRTVFTTSGFAGIALSADDIIADMDNVKKYLEQDKNCMDAIGRGFENINMDELWTEIQTVRDAVPKTCAEANSGAYGNAITAVQAHCRQMKGAYLGMRQNCATLDIELSDSQCNTFKLPYYQSEFQAYCAQEVAACATAADPAACYENVNTMARQSFTDSDGNTITIDEISEETDKTFYKNGDPEGSLNLNYFTGIKWETTVGGMLGDDVAK